MNSATNSPMSSTPEQTDQQIEWAALQYQYDAYEKYALLIKLLSVVLLVLAEIMQLDTRLLLLIVLVLWLQDAIWKTFQSRIDRRLLLVEQSYHDATGFVPFQFNSQYLAQRPGSLGLLREYLLQAVRPTIAYPHVVLILWPLYRLFA